MYPLISLVAYSFDKYRYGKDGYICLCRIHNEKRAVNTKLAKHKESVLSALEKLRGLNRAHRKLMVEIWQHLTALARLDEPPPPGSVQPGPRAFISLQNKLPQQLLRGTSNKQKVCSLY